ncbi:MAG: GAF domain-containing protein [Anaerolineae bacterium]|nr:GAF domain-containing protein [Anaerolineae bacterium]
MDITEYLQIAFAEYEQRLLASALQATAIALNSTLDLNEVLNLILVHIGSILEFGAICIMVANDNVAYAARSHGDCLRLSFADPLALERPMADAPLLTHLLEAPGPLLIEDMDSAPAWFVKAEAQGMRAYLGVALQTNKKPIGFLHLLARHPFNREHAERLHAFAAQSALALNQRDAVSAWAAGGRGRRTGSGRADKPAG